MDDLISFIEFHWENRAVAITEQEIMNIKLKLSQVLERLDSGEIRVAEYTIHGWKVNEWMKKAILLFFKYSSNHMIDSGDIKYYDKIPLKFANFTEKHFKHLDLRTVPGGTIRYPAYIAKNVVLMPSFINVGAYIDEGTLVDTWSTIGSCAQIGKNCHISGGVGIGGVLEPLQANPVIIEDNVFIGARSEIAEGVIIEHGSVISMGVFIGSSTRIYDRENDNILYGKVPPYSVVVPGSLPGSDGKTHTYAAIIVKKVDDKTRAKTSLNDLLRE